MPEHRPIRYWTSSEVHRWSLEWGQTGIVTPDLHRRRSLENTEEIPDHCARLYQARPAGWKTSPGSPGQAGHLLAPSSVRRSLKASGWRQGERQHVEGGRRGDKRYIGLVGWVLGNRAVGCLHALHALLMQALLTVAALRFS